MRAKSLGISLLEVIVVLIVVLLLSGVLFTILPRYRATVERDMIDINIRNMRTGMRLKVVNLLLTGQQGNLPMLVGENPVPWLGAELPAYLGEVTSPPPSDVRGCWYFDLSHHQLVFRPSSTEFADSTKSELHWQVVPSGGRDTGVQLVEVEVKAKE